VKTTEALYRAARGIRLIMLNGGEVIINGAMCSSELISSRVNLFLVSLRDIEVSNQLDLYIVSPLLCPSSLRPSKHVPIGY